MAGAVIVAAGFSVGAPARLVVDARRRWKGTLLNTKRRPKKVREHHRYRRCALKDGPAYGREGMPALQGPQPVCLFVWTERSQQPHNPRGRQGAPVEAHARVACLTWGD